MSWHRGPLALAWGHRAGCCDWGHSEVRPVALPDDGQDPWRQLCKLEVGADRGNGRAWCQCCMSKGSLSWKRLPGEKSVVLTRLGANVIMGPPMNCQVPPLRLFDAYRGADCDILRLRLARGLRADISKSIQQDSTSYTDRS